MYLFNTHNYRLVFNLDADSPKKYIKKWKEFKIQCEENGNNKHIVDKIKEFSDLKQIKNMPYLKRLEGGLGGNNNKIHKQIRFRHIRKGQLMTSGAIPYYNDMSIIFNEIISTDVEKWSYNELDDLIYTFIKTANYYMETECVSGYIEMINKQLFRQSFR